MYIYIIKINIMKKGTILIILVLVVLSPIILNFILLIDIGIPIAGNHDGWLAYFGALIGALITLFVLQQTINRNHKENKENRKLEVLLLQNQYAKERIFLLEEALFNYQTSINSIELLNTLEMVKRGELFDSRIKLQEMGLETEKASFKIDLYLIKTANTDIEVKFTNIFNELNIEYQMLIADAIFFIDLIKYLPKDNIDEYVAYHINLSMKNDNSLEFVKNITTITQIIQDKGEYSKIKENSEDIINKRLLVSIDKITDNIERIKPVICSLIREKLDTIDLNVEET